MTGRKPRREQQKKEREKEEEKQNKNKNVSPFFTIRTSHNKNDNVFYANHHFSNSKTKI
jgi:hypothetical protein